MKSSHSLFFRFIALTLVVLSSLSCTWSLINLPDIGIAPTVPPLTTSVPTPTPAPHAEITFEAQVPVELGPGEGVTLAILDEVTGLALNAKQYSMTKVDALRYSIKLPVLMNGIIQYRYLRTGGALAQEDTVFDEVVRYRMYSVTGPGEVKDVIAGWSDQPFTGSIGRIEGAIVSATTNAPLPGILIAAGGQQTLSDSQGRYVLDGLTPGTHLIVATALDGMFAAFQQGAIVATGQVTNAPIAMQPAQLVKITFYVSVPSDTSQGAPMRMAGNLIQLGNTFGDLRGGMSGLAMRMPVLQAMSDGRYTLTLKLPAGAHVRYKYTLGDGFWNAEHAPDGSFLVRDLIVPGADAAIQDSVATWSAGNSGPILFEVTAPSNTPPGDTVFIQFNPYGWTEPLPMWPLGNNRWVYKLFGPLNMLGTFHYRFCRNEQCGSADDVATIGQNPLGRSAATSITAQDLQDNISAWNWLPETEPGAIMAVEVKARSENFWAGIEFQPGYHPSFQSWYLPALQNAQGLGANWFVLTPSWSLSHAAPLAFAPIPGKDPLWNDAAATIGQARGLNLNVALFPVPSQPAGDWWSAAPRTPEWWATWFDRYRAFALYHADLAAQNGAGALILGGDWLAPALPGGQLANGTDSAVPVDAEARYRAIIKDVRARFNGKILWALPYNGAFGNVPAFISDVDGLYVLWNAPLTQNTNPTVEEMQATAATLLDRDLAPLLTQLQKTAVIAVAYPSATGAATACLPSPQGGCLDWMALNRPNDDIPSISINMTAQVDIYKALFLAINERTWLSGLVSRGYYPPASLIDKSASIHGKPTADLIWYWFPRLRGAVK